jgi:hypothetical protein
VIILDNPNRVAIESGLGNQALDDTGRANLNGSAHGCIDLRENRRTCAERPRTCYLANDRACQTSETGISHYTTSHRGLQPPLRTPRPHSLLKPDLTVTVPGTRQPLRLLSSSPTSVDMTASTSRTLSILYSFKVTRRHCILSKGQLTPMEQITVYRYSSVQYWNTISKEVFIR